MNTFANTLFSAMLGWVRSIVAGIFRMVSDGSASSFIRWTTTNWLPLLIVIILAGLILDTLVWLIRWRPHYVWFSAMYSLRGKKRIRHGETEDRKFQSGFNEGMGYEFFDADAEPVQLVSPEAAQEGYDLSALYQTPGLHTVSGQDYAYETPAGPTMQDSEAGYYPANIDNDGISGGMPAQETVSHTRRRRSDQHKPRLFGALSKVGERLLNETAGDRLMDNPSPPIAKKDAFYDPVYPSREPLRIGRQDPRAMPMFGHDKNTTGQNGGNSP